MSFQMLNCTDLMDIWTNERNQSSCQSDIRIEARGDNGTMAWGWSARPTPGDLQNIAEDTDNDILYSQTLYAIQLNEIFHHKS